MTRIVEVTPVPTETPIPEPTQTFQKYTSQDALDAQRFVMPSLGDDKGARVFSFASPDDLNIVKNYYENLPAMFGTWVFVKDNLLFQFAYSYPKELADKYKDVFNNLD